jgi:hypothetical protein
MIGAEAKCAGVKSEGAGPGERLLSLMRALAAKRGRRVAVIIDDLDGPLRPVLGIPEAVGKVMEALRDLTRVLEGPEDWRGPILMTAIVRPPLEDAPGRPVLATLRDVTWEPALSKICGVTAGKFEAVLGGLEGREPKLVHRRLYSYAEAPEDVPKWFMEVYGAYWWGGPEPVANTGLVLSFLRGVPQNRLDLNGRRRFRLCPEIDLAKISWLARDISEGMGSWPGLSPLRGGWLLISRRCGGRPAST